MQCSPLGRVPKAADDVVGTAAESRAGAQTSGAPDVGRFIYDAVRGANPITPPEGHPPSVLPMHSDVTLYIVFMSARFPGVPVVLPMRDVSRAFKLMWLSPSDAHWFGTRLKCPRLAAKIPMALKFGALLIIFTVMQFGWTESSGEYCAHGAAISQAHRSLDPADFYRRLT